MENELNCKFGILLVRSGLEQLQLVCIHTCRVLLLVLLEHAIVEWS